MMLQSFVFVVLLSITSQVVLSQDIVFPGETERPNRFPIFPTLPTNKPSTGDGEITRLPTPSTTQSVPTPTTQFVPTPTTQSVPTPTTQSPPVTPPVSGPAYLECFGRCGKTAEYNPVCGSDGEVYYNPGNLNCAKLCGRNTELTRFGLCEEQ